MSALTQTRGETLPAVSHALPLSGSLAYYVAGDARIGDHIAPAAGNPSPADVEEAKRMLPQAEHLCRTVQPGVIRQWCLLIASSVRNPPTQEDFGHRVSAIAAACADLPAAVWTSATAREGAGTFQFWPSAADIRSLLLPHAQKVWRQRDGLQRIASHGAPTPAVAYQPPSDDAREHVANLVRAFTAERSWQAPRGPEDQRVPVKPCFLSTERLIVEYEKLAKQGNRAAVIRLEMLRAKLEQERADV